VLRVYKAPKAHRVLKGWPVLPPIQARAAYKVLRALRAFKAFRAHKVWQVSPPTQVHGA
jgi:hypothetical protein